MDPTGRFFAKLKELAVTLESETAKLQLAFENRNNDPDSESTTKGMRAYHELNCDVGKLKGQIQEHLAQQKTQENEASTFIKACGVMKQRVTEDIQALRGHWEKYGYQAPPDTQRPASIGEESVAEGDVAEEEEESQEGAGGNDSPLSPEVGPPPFNDVMHTPQLSDFGLSEMQLKRALAGAAWCSEVPPMPEMSLPQPSLNKHILTPKPMTPKCALRMDDDELQTPQMHEFGISEHTMCLNNDFTMDLLRKNTEKAPRPPEDIPALPVNSVTESFQAKGDSMEVQEPPVFSTPGLKIKKTNGHRSPPVQGDGDSEFPVRPSNEPSTPEVPAFQTPYMNRLVSTKKQPKPINMQADDENSLELPCNRLSGTKRPYRVPEVSVLGVEDMQMPELPNLESTLGNSLQTRSAKMQKLKADAHEKVTQELTVNGLEQDGPTQEFSLGTPRFRADFPDPSTPLMPDLSSVTQDICKLVSQAQLKTAMAVVRPNVRTEEKKKSAVIQSVSESEFQSLPGYLRQMTLYSLNQAVHKINKFIAECSGEKTEFHMEELSEITSVGTKTPMYVVCLSELNRLKHLRGSRNTAVYKLSTHN